MWGDRGKVSFLRLMYRLFTEITNLVEKVEHTEALVAEAVSPARGV